MTTIGERVKTAREQRGIHQAKLVRRLGCSVNALSMLEKYAITDPRASRIVGIAEVMGGSADYLLGLQEDAQTVPRVAKVSEAATAPTPSAKRPRPRR